MRSLSGSTTRKNKGKGKKAKVSVRELVFTALKQSAMGLWWIVRRPPAIAAFAVFLLFIWAIHADVPQRIQHYLFAKTSDASTAMGAVLENVYLEGQQYTKTQDILDVLNVKIGYPLVAIPLDDIRDRLEQLPWVRYAVVDRQLPSTLSVHIVERTPAALWQHDKQLKLVDPEGQVIETNDLSPFQNLVIMVGKDIPLYTNYLLNLLNSEESLKDRVSSFIRVGERRWNVQLRNGIMILLPEEETETAWHRLAQLQHEKNLLNDEDIESIDLRFTDKLYIKKKSLHRSSRKGRSA